MLAHVRGSEGWGSQLRTGPPASLDVAGLSDELDSKAEYLPESREIRGCGGHARWLVRGCAWWLVMGYFSVCNRPNNSLLKG